MIHFRSDSQVFWASALPKTMLRFPFVLPVVSALAAMVSTSSAATVLSDDFDNGDPLTGAAVHPNAWKLVGSTATESNGALTFSTAANSAQYSQTSFTTGVSSDFNIFTQTVQISVTDFSITGDGVNASAGKNFRLGLMPSDTAGATVSSFFSSGNDGVCLRLVDGKAFQINYKANSAANGDPGLTGSATTGSAAATLPFVVTGFDLAFSATTWSATFHGAGGETSVNAGTWNLTPFASTWGNAGDGFGNAALLIYDQNGSVGTGSVSTTIGSIQVTTVPEPRTALLGAFGTLSLGLLRRRR
jgi:hypothetical protein